MPAAKKPTRRRPSRSRARHKVPVVRQSEVTDCGPACLAMVLKAHGKKAPLEQIKKRLRLTRRGVDAYTLLETAAHFGLKGRGVEAGIGALRRLPLPAILHWDRMHYVVLVRLGEDVAEIIDPGFGVMRLTLKIFEQHFSGTVLLFGQS